MEILMTRQLLLATGFTLATLLLVWVTVRFRLLDRWARTLIRITSGVISFPLALLSVLGWWATSCNRHSPLAGAPDGRTVARVLVMQGWNEPDPATVIVRRSWSPFWTTVSSGDGFAGDKNVAIEPHLIWRDNSHLVITYYNGAVFSCLDKTDSVSVTCETK